jgi:hypothetical protein
VTCAQVPKNVAMAITTRKCNVFMVVYWSVVRDCRWLFARKV